MKKKALPIILVIILCLLGGLFYQNSREKERKEFARKKEEAVLTIEANQSKVSDKGKWNVAVDDLTDEAGFLTLGVTSSDFMEIEKALAKIKEENQNLVERFDLALPNNSDIEKVLDKLAFVRQKFEFEKEVMTFFEIKDQFPINGPTLNTNVPLKQTTTELEVQKLQTAFDEQFIGKNDAWIHSMTEKLQVISEQVFLIQKANELIDKFTIEEVATIEILINNIKANETKKVLSNRLELKIG